MMTPRKYTEVMNLYGDFVIMVVIRTQILRWLENVVHLSGNRVANVVLQGGIRLLLLLLLIDPYYQNPGLRIIHLKRGTV